MHLFGYVLLVIDSRQGHDVKVFVLVVRIGSVDYQEQPGFLVPSRD